MVVVVGGMWGGWFRWRAKEGRKALHIVVSERASLSSLRFQPTLVYLLRTLASAMRRAILPQYSAIMACRPKVGSACFSMKWKESKMLMCVCTCRCLEEERGRGSVRCMCASKRRATYPNKQTTTQAMPALLQSEKKRMEIPNLPVVLPVLRPRVDDAGRVEARDAQVVHKHGVIRAGAQDADVVLRGVVRDDAARRVRHVGLRGPDEAAEGGGGPVFFFRGCDGVSFVSCWGGCM